MNKIDVIYGSATIRPEVQAAIITSEGGDMNAIEIFFIAAIVVILGAVAYGSYERSQRPTFALDKADWRCTKSHQETITTYQDMGGGKTIMLIPITTTSTVCDEWARR